MNIKTFLKNISETTELLSKKTNLSGEVLYQFLPDLLKFDEFIGVEEIKILNYPVAEINDRMYVVGTAIITDPAEFNLVVQNKTIYIHSIGYVSSGFQLHLGELSDINLTEEWYDIDKDEYSKFLIFKLPTTLNQQEKDDLLMKLQDTEEYIKELKIKNSEKFNESLKILCGTFNVIINNINNYQIKNIDTTDKIFIRYFIK